MSLPRLLVIDDDNRLTESLELVFEDDGAYELLVENDSTKALQVAREFQPDIILLDIVMPGMDGGDVSALLQDDPELNDVPVVVLSALVSKQDTGDAGSVELQGRSMLAKPCRFDQMKEIIDLKLAEHAAAKSDREG